MRTNPAREEIEDFVTHSTAIAGERYDPSSPSGSRHFEMARIVAVPYRFIQAELINAHLRGITGGWLRTGMPSNHRGRYPLPNHIKLLLNEWNEWVEESISRMYACSENERERFCWEAHDKLVCIRAFQERNGRTARLELNLLRGLLGLPWKAILYEATEAYYQRIDEYRETVFQPEYQAWCARQPQVVG